MYSVVFIGAQPLPPPPFLVPASWWGCLASPCAWQPADDKLLLCATLPGPPPGSKPLADFALRSLPGWPGC